MTADEELATAYANLKRHQERSLEHIRQLDAWKRRTKALEGVILQMKLRPDELAEGYPDLAREYSAGEKDAGLRINACLIRIAAESETVGA